MLAKVLLCFVEQTRVIGGLATLSQSCASAVGTDGEGASHGLMA